MRSPASRPPSPRSPGLTATATTLVALAAMTASVAGGPPPRGLEFEGRVAETAVVRAVAAAVAAVARDLAGGERATMATARLEPALGWRVDPAGAPARPVTTAAPAPAVLDERLLDLPPPRC